MNTPAKTPTPPVESLDERDRDFYRTLWTSSRRDFSWALMLASLVGLVFIAVVIPRESVAGVSFGASLFATVAALWRSADLCAAVLQGDASREAALDKVLKRLAYVQAGGCFNGWLAVCMALAAGAI